MAAVHFPFGLRALFLTAIVLGVVATSTSTASGEHGLFRRSSHPDTKNEIKLPKVSRKQQDLNAFVVGDDSGDGSTEDTLGAKIGKGLQDEGVRLIKQKFGELTGSSTDVGDSKLWGVVKDALKSELMKKLKEWNQDDPTSVGSEVVKDFNEAWKKSTSTDSLDNEVEEELLKSLGMAVNIAKYSETVIGDWQRLVHLDAKDLKKLKQTHAVNFKATNQQKCSDKASISTFDETISSSLQTSFYVSMPSPSTIAAAIPGAQAAVLPLAAAQTAVGLEMPTMTLTGAQTTYESCKEGKTVVHESCRIRVADAWLHPNVATSEYINGNVLESILALQPRPSDYKTNSTWLQDYFGFFNMYGTHFIRAAGFGGFVHMVTKIENMQLIDILKRSGTAGVSAGIKNIMPTGGDITQSLTYTREAQGSLNDGNFQIVVEGGKSNMDLITENKNPPRIDPKKFQVWVKSLMKDLVRVANDLGLTVDLLIANKDVDESEFEVRKAAYVYALSEYMRLASKRNRIKDIIENLKLTVETWNKRMEELKLKNTVRRRDTSPEIPCTFSLVIKASASNICTSLCRFETVVAEMDRTLFDIHNKVSSDGSTFGCSDECKEKLRVDVECTTDYGSTRDVKFGDGEKYVSVDRELKSGWLWVQRKSFFANRWHRKWFVEGDEYLSFYNEDPTDALERGEYPTMHKLKFSHVLGVVDGTPTPSKWKPWHKFNGHTFRLLGAQQVWYLGHPSEKYKNQWMERVLKHDSAFAARTFPNRKHVELSFEEMVDIDDGEIRSQEVIQLKPHTIEYLEDLQEDEKNDDSN